ncbi:hypothetical protein HPB51_016939 [Rhipicephalus microplus]|uniref:AAA+ ATPase domain-containing protein n=1 Tax=Rhipicephalus microplus TaxID=6941 RepID=A0A9J6F3U2_RHIMP|nr:hypothetical protein HPB51_016939 [Rhipicephalus microplus]
MKSQLLYLHPSCMKMCSTGIKDVVEVSQGGQTHLLIVWPSTNVGLTCVAMSKRYRTSKSKAVTVKRHCSSVVAASSVTVISTGDAVKESDASLQKCLLQQNRLKPPRGALLFGPPGTGKTMLARAVAAESEAALVVIDGPQIFSKYYGETEATLRSLFKDAAERAPSIVFIDEIDALCPKRESGTSNQEARAVATLVSLIDSLPLVEDKWVLVLGATNRPNFVDPSLRQPGRLDREIEIGVPTAHGRQQILQKILSNVNHSLSNEDITEIADVAHGLTGADLAAVCADAALRSLERNIASKNASDAALSKVVQLTKADMATALRHTKPSAMREVALEIPKVRWSDIGGMKEVKLKLQQVVEWPWKHRDAFIRLGVTPPCGVLLYGPPGCSKTMIAKALATESGLNFIAIKARLHAIKWVGDSERAVRDLFRKARAASPCIIFFDEIDALAVHRGSTSGSSNVGDRVIAQLLTEMDGIEKLEDVILVAATNRPDMIDQALMRPGRLDSIVYVPLPDFDTRKEILHLNLSKKPLGDDVDIEALTSKTSGYSGAEETCVVHCVQKKDSSEREVPRGHHFACPRKGLDVRGICLGLGKDHLNKWTWRPATAESPPCSGQFQGPLEGPHQEQTRHDSYTLGHYSWRTDECVAAALRVQ